jgi:hypothetical protein
LFLLISNRFPGAVVHLTTSNSLTKQELPSHFLKIKNLTTCTSTKCIKFPRHHPRKGKKPASAKLTQAFHLIFCYASQNLLTRTGDK